MIANLLFYIIVVFLIADFITGLVHWAEDTYCVPSPSAYLSRLAHWTYDAICEPNLRHHANPTSMLQHSDWVNIRLSLAFSATFGILWAALAYWASCPLLFVLAAGIFLSGLGNLTHKWTHTKAPKFPRALQDMGILQTAHQHARHHKYPHLTCYCAMGNLLNPLLDALGFWRALEYMIMSVSWCVSGGKYVIIPKRNTKSNTKSKQ